MPRSPFSLPPSLFTRPSGQGWSLDVFIVLMLSIVVVTTSTLFIASNRATAFFSFVPFLRLADRSSVPSIAHHSQTPSSVYTRVSSIQSAFSKEGDRGESALDIQGVDYGFPPKLQGWHAHAELLNSIRLKTKLSPRWPPGNIVDVHKLRSYGPAYSSIVVSQKLHVVYIPVFKVGTTSMMWQIAYLENNTHVLKHARKQDSILQHFLHDMSTDAWKSHALCHMANSNISHVLSDPSLLKFTFVRNPYSRLVSAYVDKVFSVAIESREYQRQMYALFGDNVAQRKKANETRPSFEAYVSAVYDVLMSPRTKSNDPNNDIFEDNLSRRDVHWRPQTELVHPDIIPIDFVGRFEHANRDQNVVLNWMHKHTERRIPNDVSIKLHKSDPALKQALLEQLKLNTRLQQMVYRMYVDDFQKFMFESRVPDSL